MPKTEENSLEYSYNKEPKCPYCDLEINIEKHDMQNIHTEDESTIYCPDCDKEIVVYGNVTWTFSTHTVAWEK